LPAYPFAPLLTLEQLTERLTTEFGCTLTQTKGNLTKEGGSSLPIVYFERQTDQGTLRAVVHVPQHDALIQFSVMRSICAQLRIDPAAFGLELG
jgi:hypothetical protein